MVDERVKKTGECSYRVRFRWKGMADFCISFDDKDAALEWQYIHKLRFLKNPEHYYRWKDDLYWEMMAKGETVRDHMLLPKRKFVKVKKR